MGIQSMPDLRRTKMITKTVAQDLAERLDLPTDLVAWGYGGSRMYGLETAESDYDVILITSDLKPGCEIHSDMGNRQDVWAMSLGDYMQGVGASKPNYVNLSISPTMHWNSGSPLYTLAKLQGINLPRYLDSLYRHAKSDSAQFSCRELGDPRGTKSLRVSIRGLTIISKVIKSFDGTGPTLQLKFTEAEKDNLESTYLEAREFHGQKAHVWYIVKANTIES